MTRRKNEKNYDNDDGLGGSDYDGDNGEKVGVMMMMMMMQ